MALRCRKDDMAIMVAGRFVGHVVDILEYDSYHAGSHWWEIKASIPIPSGASHWIARDEYMIPIRPGDLKETDETEKTLEYTE